MARFVATCTHLSKLPLTILLLSTATQLWDGMALEKLKSKYLPCTRCHTSNSCIYMYRDINKMEDCCWFWFEDTFHLPDPIVSMQHSYTFSSINVPYSVAGEKCS